MPLDLSAPKVITFIISVIVAIIAVVIHYAHIAIPHVHSGFVDLVGRLPNTRRRKRPSRDLSRSDARNTAPLLRDCRPRRMRCRVFG